MPVVISRLQLFTYTITEQRDWYLKLGGFTIPEDGEGGGEGGGGGGGEAGGGGAGAGFTHLVFLMLILLLLAVFSRIRSVLKELAEREKHERLR
jgi:hypothetical protein